jgi:hypothetical protein
VPDFEVCVTWSKEEAGKDLVPGPPFRLYRGYEENCSGRTWRGQSLVGEGIL